MDETKRIRPGQFEQLVFSGGGTRCFWHGGFFHVVRGPLAADPKRITGVSGGALSASSFIAQNGPRLLQVMGDAFERQSQRPAVRGAFFRGLMPHKHIYRQVVADVMDADAVAAIAEGPQFQITLAVPPAHLPLRLGAYLSLMAYKLDQITRSNPHIIFPSKLGARKLMVDARQAARDGLLVELIVAAATIPPVFDIGHWPPGEPGSPPVIDAGTVDNAPMPEPDEGETLILMTRHYRDLPPSPRRTYVEPGTPVPASKLDFSSREKIERSWEIGEQDGHAFLAAHGLAHI